ncbi:hypothetical protein JGU66_11905 [Myxococcaceae bacterium JPH2]|nr:hypothetical protein [Myxococcaceae bacterium JPH2]
MKNAESSPLAPELARRLTQGVQQLRRVRETAERLGGIAEGLTVVLAKGEAQKPAKAAAKTQAPVRQTRSTAPAAPPKAAPVAAKAAPKAAAKAAAPEESEEIPEYQKLWPWLGEMLAEKKRASSKQS